MADTLLGDFEVNSSQEGQGLIEALMEGMKVSVQNETPADKQVRQRKQRSVLDRALGLSGRIDDFKRVVECRERIIQMRRQAFGITSETQEGLSAVTVKELSDAERASRLAALLDVALKRKAAAQSI